MSDKQQGVNYIQSLGGLCFAHGPHGPEGCKEWPKCATDPQKFKPAREDIRKCLEDNLWAISERPTAAHLRKLWGELEPLLDRHVFPSRTVAAQPDTRKLAEYFIFNTDHGDNAIFWRPNRSGYTHILEEAGRYSKEEAIKISVPRDSGEAQVDFMVPCETVEAVCKRVARYRDVERIIREDGK